jgi:CelD/BcsL family acetyltransferase involved in cellulose biosynthesis
MREADAQTCRSGARLEIVDDPEALCRLAVEWWALWDRVGEATPFQTPAWLLPWWRAFAPGRLLTLAIRRDGELIALAPFYVDEHARALPVGVALSDYFDVLIDPAHFCCAAEQLRRAWRGGFAGAPKQWEMIELFPDAKVFALQIGAVAPAGVCPVLEIPLGAQGACACVPASKRRKLAMARHRAERAGGVTIERASGADLSSSLDALVRLQDLRWRQCGGGVLGDERVRRFHALALPELDRAGLLDLLLCRMRGEIIAVYYGLRDARRSYAYLGGYDPDAAFISPCVLLIGRAIDDAARRGAREFHFLRGGEAYKYEWGARDRINGRIVIRTSDR